MTGRPPPLPRPDQTIAIGADDRNAAQRPEVRATGDGSANAALAGVCRVQLGAEGPLVLLTVARPGEAADEAESTTSFYVLRIFSAAVIGVPSPAYL